VFPTPRFERKGFKLVGLKLYQTPKEVAEEHYKDLASKPFYPKLVEYIVSGPVVAMVRRGPGGGGSSWAAAVAVAAYAALGRGLELCVAIG
jgi:hypothetical protein